MWVNEEENSRLLTLAEDSGYDTNLADRIVAIAKECAGKYVDVNTKQPRLENLPKFDPSNYVVVTVKVVGKPEKAAVRPVEPPVAEDAAEETGPLTVRVITAMNKDDLSARLGVNPDDYTKAELVEMLKQAQV